MTSIPNLRSAEFPRPAGDPLENGVRRGGSQIIDAADRLKSRAVDIDKITLDFRLVTPLRDALQPLTGAGFMLEDKEIVTVGEQRQVTLLTRAPESYYLVSLPAIVVHSDTTENRMLFAMMNLLFPNGSQIYLLAHRVDVLPIRLEMFLQNYREVTAQFVPSAHVCGEDGKSTMPLGALLAAFHLSRDPVPATNEPSTLSQPSPSDALGQGEPLRMPSQGELDLIAANLAAIIWRPAGTQASYNDFVLKLQLAQNLVSSAQAEWNEDLSISARNLVRWADSRGRGTLGRLIGRIVEDAPGRDDARRMVGIASDCGLINPDRVTELSRMIDDEMERS